MPLTPKGAKIKKAMQAKYGKAKGEQVFYASKNKGTISGVESARMREAQARLEAVRRAAAKKK